MTKFLRTVVSLTAIFLTLIPLRGAEPVQILPVGTFLPVMLNNTLDSDKSKPGEKLTARLKQDVSLQDGSTVKAGTELFGHVVSASRGSATGGSRVVFV